MEDRRQGGAKRGRTTLPAIFARREMPGARRAAPSVLADAVIVGALRRELPACVRGPADRWRRRAQRAPARRRGTLPAPESAKCPSFPSGSGTRPGLAAVVVLAISL